MSLSYFPICLYLGQSVSLLSLLAIMSSRSGMLLWTGFCTCSDPLFIPGTRLRGKIQNCHRVFSVRAASLRCLVWRLFSISVAQPCVSRVHCSAHSPTQSLTALDAPSLCRSLEGLVFAPAQSLWRAWSAPASELDFLLAARRQILSRMLHQLLEFCDAHSTKVQCP